MQIIPMTAAHTAKLAELEKLCFSEPWSEKALSEEIDNPAAYFIAAVEDGTVFGYGGMHTVLGESYIDNIAVFPEYRGRGVGRAVTKALIEKAKENDGVFITLEVRASNTPAITLYTSLGFETAGVRKRFYKDPDEDALIMTLSFTK
ncbi:MAG: ribosomal protein S18-alanine N-acetyltransferase [Clostridia bacterium]|nr:ribosomal protein S18-alanine N-acetyltransferase [Clostridia bacterium]